jgi:Carboxypeptidase regulatory-like domain
MRVCTWILLTLTIIGTATAQGQGTPAPQYAGRSLPDVLRQLRARGLNVVYSSELVRPEMRVTAEPKATSLRQILDEVLAPHGLRVVSGPRNTLLVVISRKSSPTPPPPQLRTGVIRGTVTDKRSGSPLPGVMVSVQGSPLTATTGPEGEFRIDDVPAEPQFLYVSLVGYGLARPVVDVRPGQESEVHVVLADGVGTFSQEITVTTDPFRLDDPVTPSLETLTNADFQDLRGVLADDPQRAVQSLPGVATGDDFRSEFSVRGSDYQHIGISVDDIPVGWLVHSAQGIQDTASISILNGDAIESGSLYSGPYVQRRPGRLGAWLEYDLREGSRTATQGHLSVSGTAASISIDGPIGTRQRGSWIASVRQSYIDWLIRRLDPGKDAVLGFSDFTGKLVYDVASRHQLQLYLLAGRSKVQEFEDEPGPNALNTAISRSAVAALTWRSTFQRALLTQRLSLHGGNFRNTGHFHQVLGDGHTVSISYFSDAILDLGRGISLRSGVGIVRTRSAQTIRQFSFSAPGVTAVRSEDGISQPAWTSSTYTSLAWQSARGIAVEAGAGISHSSEVAGSPVSAWGLGAYPLAHGWTARAGASGSWQFPEAEQIARRGTAPLVPEHAFSLDAGIERRMGDSFHWQVTLFSRQEQNVLRLDGAEGRLVGPTFTPPSPDSFWRNALSGTSHGIEFMVQRRAAARLSGWIGYSYGRARYTDSTARETFWADFDQRQTLNIYGQYRVTPKTTLSGKLRAGSNFPLPGYFMGSVEALSLSNLRNQVRLPVYSRLDIRMNHTFTYRRRRLTLFAEVLNVLGRTHLGPSDGTIRTDGSLSGFTEKLLPFLPSAGFVFDF